MLRSLDAARVSFRTGSHGENRTARCDRASGFLRRVETIGRISARLAGSQTHVGTGIGAHGIQAGGQTVGSGLRLRSLAKTGSAVKRASGSKTLDGNAEAKLLFAASGGESQVVRGTAHAHRPLARRLLSLGRTAAKCAAAL